MAKITAEKITHAYAAVEIITNASFHVNTSDRVGLVGPNGEGKSTLLRLIGGYLKPLSGSITRAAGTTIGYLPQDPPALDGQSVYGAMAEVFAEIIAQEQRLHKLADDISRAHDSRTVEEYGRLQTAFEDAGGYDYHNRIEQVLTGLGFERDMWDKPLAELSGGQRTRAYLASLLLKNPDILMLDEPTNHLDVDTVGWLEKWLESYQGALIVVSHDRYFLDRVTDHTWEIAFATLETYRGAYSQYLPKRIERHNERLKLYNAQQEYIAKTRDFIRQYIAGQRSAEAKGRRKRLERFIADESIPHPRLAPEISFNLAARKRSGDMVMLAENIAVGYQPQPPLVEAKELKIMRGEKIAIVGANGIGKTTLLRSLIGELKPLAGTVKFGTNVEMGYLSQTHSQLDPTATAHDSLATAGGLKSEKARDLLGSLLLSGDDAFKKISELSGGQRSRVVLAQLIATQPNLLLLDEPTNHLDIASTEVIQKNLQQYDGTVIFITHDRYLVEKVATHIWAIDGGKIFHIYGGWEAYLEWREQKSDSCGKSDSLQAAVAKEKQVKAQDYREAKKQANLIQKLKRRHDQIEQEIDASEKLLTEISDGITSASQAGDLKAVEKLGLDYQKCDTKLQELLHEWEQLAEQLAELE